VSTLPFLTGAIGFAIVWVLIPQILRYSSRMAWLQRAPDFHHTNEAPVPRFGGLALMVAFLVIELLLTVAGPAEREHALTRLVVVLSCAAMFGLGFWDDIRPLGAKRKLAGQVLIALAVWACGPRVETFRLPVTGVIINLHGWSVFFTVLWLVGMTNLINLIDGVDGLAGGICLMLMVLTTYVGGQNGTFQLLAPGMAGALLAFLRYNFPPARIYLGDGGAYFLGFQIGLYALINSQKGTILVALVAPLFVLALPILDTTLAILRRGLKGLPIFRPDRRHIHHHLLGMGLSRRQVVIAMYSVTLFFLVLGLIAFWSQGKLVPSLLGVGVIVLLLCAGQLNFSREWFAVGRVLGNSLDMRRDVQYALSLTRWLALEGRRSPSVEGLWSDLTFAARKLGFASLRLILEDGERAWKRPGLGQSVGCFRYELQCGRAGALEFGVPWPSQGLPVPTESPRSISAHGSDLFEILSELLAEAWVKAARSLLNGNGASLRFSPVRPDQAYRLNTTPAASVKSHDKRAPLPPNRTAMADCKK
jgi:UDP-GlcNAc:undecaprenyl-phosphate/decaprenyl-phosphate GlcNAc-1-phosphate transferase